MLIVVHKSKSNNVLRFRFDTIFSFSRAWKEFIHMVAKHEGILFDFHANYILALKNPYSSTTFVSYLM